MSFTTYYNLEKFTYGTEEWNSAYSTNFDKNYTALNDISTTASGADSDLTTHKASADHDGRYYTESEVDALNTTHSGGSDHDGRYYTESEVDALIAAVTASGISGWADDGANFRLTFTNGLITAVGTTVSGGYYQS
jgi:hypothetical protein